MFSSAHQNPMGFTKLRKMVKVKTSSGEQGGTVKRVIEGLRNQRALESNKENRINILNDLKRNSENYQSSDQKYGRNRGGLWLVSKENESLRNPYKNSFKMVPSQFQLQNLHESNFYERPRPINQDSYNHHRVNTSLKLKYSLSKGVNQNSLDFRNITDRKLGYHNLVSKRLQKMKSSNTSKSKTQRQSLSLTKQIYFQSSSIKGSKQYNQDTIKTGQNVWIVCDGHGEHGHNVSWYTANVLYELYQQRRLRQNFSKAMLRDVFVEVQRNLEESGIQIDLSGSTCVMVVLEGDKIYCACTGDSVAIAIFDDLSYQVMSTEHKPHHPQQAKRIQFFGGVIKKTVGKQHLPASPYRMWGQGTDQWGPGLAISRSFGDKMAQKYGLIYQPQIKQLPLQRSLKYIVLGSDGLFDQVTPTQIANILKIETAVQEQETCKMLTQIAQSRWIGYSDDISAVVIYL